MRVHFGFSKRIKLSTLIKIVGGLLALLGLYFSSTAMVYAEEFNNASSFHYWTYSNTDTMKDEGTGLINNHLWNDPINRVQWLYSAYQYYTGYMYDITFTYYASSIPLGNQGILDFVDSCSIGTGGSSYQCYLNKGTSNGEDYVQISIANFVGNNQNNLWINFYSNTNKMVYLNPTRYVLKINAKQDTGATSEDIYNATNNIITNNNNNTNIINGSLNDINDSLTDDNVSSATSNAEDLLDNIDVSEPIGLTSIITAPIRLLQSLINGGSCNGLSFDINLNGTPKNVTIPSGCILWDNVPSSVVVIYYIMVYGLFGYRILVDMVHFIDSLRDPDKKNEYTLDL